MGHGSVPCWPLFLIFSVTYNIFWSVYLDIWTSKQNKNKETEENDFSEEYTGQMKIKDISDGTYLGEKTKFSCFK